MLCILTLPDLYHHYYYLILLPTSLSPCSVLYPYLLSLPPCMVYLPYLLFAFAGQVRLFGSALEHAHFSMVSFFVSLVCSLPVQHGMAGMLCLPYCTFLQDICSSSHARAYAPAMQCLLPISYSTSSILRLLCACASSAHMQLCMRAGDSFYITYAAWWPISLLLSCLSLILVLFSLHFLGQNIAVSWWFSCLRTPPRVLPSYHLVLFSLYSLLPLHHLFLQAAFCRLGLQCGCTLFYPFSLPLCRQLYMGRCLHIPSLLRTAPHLPHGKILRQHAPYFLAMPSPSTHTGRKRGSEYHYGGARLPLLLGWFYLLYSW